VTVSADPFLRRRAVALADWRAWRHFVIRWGISIASLGSGLTVLFVFRRGLPHVGWIVGYVVVLWLLFAVLAQVRERLLAGGRRLVVTAGDYTIQTLYHDLLLFVLPAYWASTTLDGPTVPFLVVLALATLLTTVDPWYRAVVHPHPWLGRIFFTVSLFAGLNVALPLIGLPPAWAPSSSVALAVVALVPASAGARRVAGAVGRAVPVALGAAGLAWLGLPVIPPAPLQLVRPTMARAGADLAPVDPVARATVADLQAWGGLSAFTPVAAPAGLRQPIAHRWRHEGRVMATVYLLTPVQGGRAGGFRTYSRRTEFGPDAVGRWTVDVLTDAGQLIGRVRFRVDP
jgi:uncharacterized protein DUF5924/DUF2914 family protein